MVETKTFCRVNVLGNKASRNQLPLIATILEMGPLPSSALTTPFVFTEGGGGGLVGGGGCSHSTLWDR